MAKASLLMFEPGLMECSICDLHVNMKSLRARSYPRRIFVTVPHFVTSKPPEDSLVAKHLQAHGLWRANHI